MPVAIRALLRAGNASRALGLADRAHVLSTWAQVLSDTIPDTEQPRHLTLAAQ
jgi:hypothetical protein